MQSDELDWQLYDNIGAPVPRQPDKIRPGVCAVIFNELGEILLEHRSDNGFWGMPGGAVDIGESVAEAVVREVMEETGLTVGVKRLIGVYSDPRGNNIATYSDGIVQGVSLCFLCENRGGELRISEEHGHRLLPCGLPARTHAAVAHTAYP